MTIHRKKIVVAVTGASGAVYASVLLEKLQQLSDQIETVGLVLSDNAKDVWEYELGDRSFEQLPYTVYDPSPADQPGLTL